MLLLGALRGERTAGPLAVMTLVEAIAAVVCEPGIHTTDPVVLSATLQVLITAGRNTSHSTIHNSSHDTVLTQITTPLTTPFATPVTTPFTTQRSTPSSNTTYDTRHNTTHNTAHDTIHNSAHHTSHNTHTPPKVESEGVCWFARATAQHPGL